MRLPFRRSTIETYTQGECYALALALHDLTGWDLVGVCAEDPQPVDHSSPFPYTVGIGHVAVITPDDLLLDITGARHHDTMMHHWLAVEIVQPVDQAPFIAEFREKWRPVDYIEPVQKMKARDRRLARRVLELYEGRPVDWVPTEWWTSNLAEIGMDLSNATFAEVSINYERVRHKHLGPRLRCEHTVRDLLFEA